MEILSVCKKIRAGPVLTPRRAYTLSTVEYTPMGGQICHFDLPPMMHRVVTGLSPATRSHVDATSCREMHSSQMALAEPSALQHGRTNGNKTKNKKSSKKQKQTKIFLNVPPEVFVARDSFCRPAQKNFTTGLKPPDRSCRFRQRTLIERRRLTVGRSSRSESCPLHPAQGTSDAGGDDDDDSDVKRRTSSGTLSVFRCLPTMSVEDLPGYDLTFHEITCQRHISQGPDPPPQRHNSVTTGTAPRVPPTHPPPPPPPLPPATGARGVPPGYPPGGPKRGLAGYPGNGPKRGPGGVPLGGSRNGSREACLLIKDSKLCKSGQSWSGLMAVGAVRKHLD